MGNNEFYINCMTRTYTRLKNSYNAAKYPGTRTDFKDFMTVDNDGKANESGEVSASEKINAWLVENMTLEEYKQYIYDKISEIPMHPSQILHSVSVSISDEGFAAMQKDSEYEKWVLDTLRQDFGFYNPWCSVSGGSFTVHRFGKSKEEYRGDSWYMGFQGGKGSILFDKEAEEGFWKRRSKRHKEYIKQSQEIADEKKIMKRVYQEAAMRRGDWENMFDGEGAALSLNLANLLFTSGKKEIKD